MSSVVIILEPGEVIYVGRLVKYNEVKKRKRNAQFVCNVRQD